MIDCDQIIIILNKLSEQKLNRLGAAPYAPIMMLKVILLQSWYTLSDVKMENILASDEEGFVMNVEFTTGSVHDSNVFQTLLTGDETAVYADSAYANEKTTVLLKEKGIANNILRRAYRNRPLSKEGISFNRTRSGIRSRVESVFGIGKMHIGMGQARCRA